MLKGLKLLLGHSLLGKTLNSEILKNSSGQVQVAKKKFGSGRVAGTRQALLRSMPLTGFMLRIIKAGTTAHL